MTNTTSDFGREMDSLADVISFGIAPAVLAYAWGVQFIDGTLGPHIRDQILRFFQATALCLAVRLLMSGVIRNRLIMLVKKKCLHPRC